MPKTSSAGSAGLRALTARSIIASIADAAERWTDADFPPRVRVTAAIEARLGYTTPVVDYALDRLFETIRRDALEQTIAGELGSLDTLDGFVSRDDGIARWARGVERVAIVSSDTTIGVALVPAVFALCAKANVVVKDRSDDLIAAFFETLVQERSEFATAALARSWTGGGDSAERALLGAADAVVAFGGVDALRGIRDTCNPEARFVPFGHRASIGLVNLAHGAIDTQSYERIAFDALLYDGDGCLSLHALFAVGGDANAVHLFAQGITKACERVEVDFPAAPLPAARAAAASSYRNLAAFRAAAGRGGVYQTPGGASIVVDPPRDEPPPLLPRTIPIYSVANFDAVTAYINECRIPVQAIGCIDAGSAAVGAVAQAIGAVRIARFGEMQSPPLSGRHGGFARIADFVRWIERT